MLIDWFTVGAQALNFLILVWLLRRFLYRPVLSAIDARETRIAAELADADAKRTEAQRDRDELQHKLSELDRQRASLLERATGEAKAEGQRILEQARKAAQDASTRSEEALRREDQNLSQALRRRTQQEVFAIAKKTLVDLASVDLEERMVRVFTQRLGEMDETAKRRLAAALETASEPALVRSAFDLTEQQRADIEKALGETLSAEIELSFVTKPEVVTGIELAAGGQKLAWSVADYLSSLEKGVDELLTGTPANQGAGPEPKDEPASR